MGRGTRCPVSLTSIYGAPLSCKNGTANRKIFHNKTRRDSRSRQDTRASGFLCSQQRWQTARKTMDGTIFLAFLIFMTLADFTGLLRKLPQWRDFAASSFKRTQRDSFRSTYFPFSVETRLDGYRDKYLSSVPRLLTLTHQPYLHTVLDRYVFYCRFQTWERPLV